MARCSKTFLSCKDSFVDDFLKVTARHFPSSLNYRAVPLSSAANSSTSTGYFHPVPNAVRAPRSFHCPTQPMIVAISLSTLRTKLRCMRSTDNSRTHRSTMFLHESLYTVKRTCQRGSRTCHFFAVPARQKTVINCTTWCFCTRSRTR